MNRPRSFKLFIVLFLALQFVLPLPLLADSVGKFRDVTGDVSLTRVKAVSKPKAGDNLEMKDLVSTAAKSRAKLLLSDDTLLSVGQNSQLEITSYLLAKDKRTSTISLKTGTLHSQVEKFLDPNSSFEVHTPTAVAGARGTGWLTVIELVNNVTQTSIYALEQSVAVFNPVLASQSVMVTAGTFTTVVAGMAPTLPVAFAPAAIMGIMGELGVSMPAGLGAAVGAEAGAMVAGGVTTGTVVAGAVVGAAIIGGVAIAASSSGSSDDTVVTHHHSCSGY